MYPGSVQQNSSTPRKPRKVNLENVLLYLVYMHFTFTTCMCVMYTIKYVCMMYVYRCTCVCTTHRSCIFNYIT